jgi:hypothetical protein
LPFLQHHSPLQDTAVSGIHAMTAQTGGFGSPSFKFPPDLAPGQLTRRDNLTRSIIWPTQGASYVYGWIGAMGMSGFLYFRQLHFTPDRPDNRDQQLCSMPYRCQKTHPSGLGSGKGPR